jgi:4-hydroxy-4-methyl-2-oxoglutarate aldolase
MSAVDRSARFAALDTSIVADVLDELGLVDQGLAADFTPFPADAGKLAGPAFPIAGQMSPSPVSGGDATKMEACAAVPAGAVSVWSGAGEGVCFFGELIALGMQERGCVGALVDGGVRDVAWLGRHRFPVFARYRTPVQSIGRWRVTGYGAAVVMPGATARFVTVDPGDFVLADEDGAIVVPVAVLDEVLERGEAMLAQERRIRVELGRGLSLAEALSRFGHV